jgi:SAM-dependent methyltransferase
MESHASQPDRTPAEGEELGAVERAVDATAAKPDAASAPAGPRPRGGGPSMLDLVRLSPETVFPPGGEGLYRQIARITELTEGQDVLDVGCGRGVTTRFFAEAFDVEATGIDYDGNLIADADRFAREHGVSTHAHFQASSLEDLPFKDGIFDVSVGEIALSASADPARAVGELVRVTRPMGSVVLIQLIWTGNAAAEKKAILAEHLGAEPRLLVEWKQLLREAGVVELIVEDWSDEPSPFRPVTGRPFHDLAETFSFREKLAILRRALQRWGWRGVRGAILREEEIQRLLIRERVLGLVLIKGVKWDQGPAADA